jgi:hypothetical protein
MNKHTIIIVNIFILLIIPLILGCENDEDNYFREAENRFTKFEIKDIKDNLDMLISHAVALKKEEEKSNAELAQKMWKMIDPNYDPKKVRETLRKSLSEISGKEFQDNSSEDEEESYKWTFWEAVAKAPNKYIFKTNNNDLFLKYKISKYNNETLPYYSSYAQFIFEKDNKLAFLRVFFIHTPYNYWKIVDYEFGEPRQISNKVND